MTSQEFTIVDNIDRVSDDFIEEAGIQEGKI